MAGCALVHHIAGFQACFVLAVAVDAGNPSFPVDADLPFEVCLDVAAAAQVYFPVCGDRDIGVLGIDRVMTCLAVNVIFFPGIIFRVVASCVAGHALLCTPLGTVTFPGVILLVGKVALTAGKSLPVDRLLPIDIDFPVAFTTIQFVCIFMGVLVWQLRENTGSCGQHQCYEK